MVGRAGCSEPAQEIAALSQAARVGYRRLGLALAPAGGGRRIQFLSRRAEERPYNDRVNDASERMSLRPSGSCANRAQRGRHDKQRTSAMRRSLITAMVAGVFTVVPAATLAA